MAGQSSGWLRYGTATIVIVACMTESYQQLKEIMTILSFFFYMNHLQKITVFEYFRKRNCVKTVW